MSAPGIITRQRGVNLVEIMVVLTVLGIALAAAMPEVSNWMRGLAVRNAAESVRAGVERARMEALRRNTTMTFWLVSDSGKVLSDGCVLSSSGPSWVVSGASPSGKCNATPSQTEDPMLVDSWSATEGASGASMSGLDGSGVASSSVTFNSLGQVLGTGAQMARVDVSHPVTGTRALRVQVEPGGQVRLCDPAASGSDPRRC